MAQLPLGLGLPQTQTQWAAILNPVIAAPMTGVKILPNISLVTGANVINHLLGQQMQGWLIVDNNSAAVPYRTAPLNAKTLTLTVGAPCVVSIGVF